MSNHKIKLEAETTITILPAKTITTSELDVGIASLDLVMGTANIVLTGENRPIKLYPTGTKSAIYKAAEEAVYENILIMAKDATDSGNI